MVCFFPFKKPRMCYLNCVYQKVFIFCENDIAIASDRDMGQWDFAGLDRGIKQHNIVLPEHLQTTHHSTLMLPVLSVVWEHIKKVKPSALGCGNNATELRRHAFRPGCFKVS